MPNTAVNDATRTAARECCPIREPPFLWADSDSLVSTPFTAMLKILSTSYYRRGPEE